MKNAKFSLLFLTALCSLLPNILFAQMEWICATDSAEWARRYLHTSVGFNGKMWVIGGIDDYNIEKDDIWYSINGEYWVCATDSAEWGAREGHTSVVFDNKIWILGGCNGYQLLNDVWYSVDGVNWTCAISSADWSPRFLQISLVFDDKIWILGGKDTTDYRNDVWYSTNGVNWTCATDSAGWSTRRCHASVVFNARIWVLGGEGGGRGTNDVWYSTNGVDWTQATNSAEWPGRFGHTSVVYDNKIWVAGGCVTDSSGTIAGNDVWFSIDGMNWFCAVDSADWARREYFTSVVFDNKMWIIGGTDGGYCKNDVWYSTGLGIEEGEIATPSARNDFVVYPNPAKGIIHIQISPTFNRGNKNSHSWGEDRRRGIKIFDVSGKLVKKINDVISAKEHKQEIKISLKGVNPGIYFLQLGTESKKFLVTK